MHTPISTHMPKELNTTSPRHLLSHVQQFSFDVQKLLCNDVRTEQLVCGLCLSAQDWPGVGEHDCPTETNTSL